MAPSFLAHSLKAETSSEETSSQVLRPFSHDSISFLAAALTVNKVGVEAALNPEVVACCLVEASPPRTLVEASPPRTTAARLA